VTLEEARAIQENYLNQNPWLRSVVNTIQQQQRNPQNTNQTDPIKAFEALIDTNNDRQIQASEVRELVQTTTQSIFAAADTNRDGQMSPSEINAAVAGGVRAIAQAAYQKADKDGNGQLSRAEYDQAIVEPANVVFAILDVNKDGQLSPQEIQQIERAVINQIRVAVGPEPANSPTNLIESGRLPREAAPVPSFGTSDAGQGQNRQQSGQPAPRR
jgi:Ca2+-binding EF-hand superfamily protein